MITISSASLKTVAQKKKYFCFRFARDINIVDLMLSMCIFDIILIGLVLITVMIMVIAITPWLAIPTVICACIFIYLRKIYICTSRSIRRLEGTSK